MKAVFDRVAAAMRLPCSTIKIAEICKKFFMTYCFSNFCLYICIVNKTTSLMKTNNYRSEIEIAADRIYLTIEASLTSDDELKLYQAGWNFLNDGVSLADGTPAFYFWKKN